MAIVQVPGEFSLTDAVMWSPGETAPMTVSFAGRISYQSSYEVVPFDVSWEVPVWMREVLLTPSMPIQVAEYSGAAEGWTGGTTHWLLMAVNVGPVSM
jgi:hypothetical protein